MLTYGAIPYSESGKIKSRKSEVAIVGCLSDLGGTTASGQASGAGHIRLHAEPLANNSVDTGNIVPIVRSNEAYLEEVAQHVASIARNTGIIVPIGGDDSVNYGVVAGLLDVHGSIGVLHYDAHPDMYGYGEGIDHSNWVQYVHDLGVPVRQWGCRASSPTKPLNDNTTDLPLLVAIDMDVFDPAYAPGVACPHPYGPTPHEVINDIFNMTSNRNIVGVSITEVVADRDLNAHTALLASHTIVKILNTTFANQ